MLTTADLGKDKSGKQSDQTDRPLAEFPPQAQTEFKVQGEKLLDIMFSRSLDAGFELIKHFVAINAAGVAGATAIASAVSDAAKLAIPYFFGGMVLAIFTMILVYVNGVQITLGLRKKFNAVLYSGATIKTFKFSRLMWAGVIST